MKCLVYIPGEQKIISCEKEDFFSEEICAVESLDDLSGTTVVGACMCEESLFTKCYLLQVVSNDLEKATLRFLRRLFFEKTTSGEKRMSLATFNLLSTQRQRKSLSRATSVPSENVDLFRIVDIKLEPEEPREEEFPPSAKRPRISLPLSLASPHQSSQDDASGSGGAGNTPREHEAAPTEPRLCPPRKSRQHAISLLLTANHDPENDGYNTDDDVENAGTTSRSSRGHLDPTIDGAAGSFKEKEDGGEDRSQIRGLRKKTPCGTTQSHVTAGQPIEVGAFGDLLQKLHNQLNGLSRKLERLDRNSFVSEPVKLQLPLFAKEADFEHIGDLTVWMLQQGGSHLKDFVGRCLNQLFSPAMQMRVNRTGKSGKIKFPASLETQLKESAIRLFPACTAKDTEQAIVRFFHNSADRFGQRERRRSLQKLNKSNFF